jgi:hypothetical protein
MRTAYHLLNTELSFPLGSGSHPFWVFFSVVHLYRVQFHIIHVEVAINEKSGLVPMGEEVGNLPMITSENRGLPGGSMAAPNSPAINYRQESGPRPQDSSPLA